MMHGILIVDKPEGLTSADVVRRVKRRVGGKVGHLGTLDPFATGVLPLCLGEATKVAQFLSAADKAYEGAIRLGAATDTADHTGKVVRTASVPMLSQDRLDEVARRFLGEHLQKPPMFSAVKQGGVPLYRLARRGIEVERTERPVRIDDLRLELAPGDEVRFALSCSKGTYVRVLAEEIGEALSTVAHLAKLRRTRFGSFSVNQTVALESLEDGVVRVLSVREALCHLPTERLSSKEAGAARQGQAWVLERLSGPCEGEVTVLLDPADEVAAVAVFRSGTWGFGRVLASPQPLQDSARVLVGSVK